MVNNLSIGTAGIKLIQEFEGFRSEAYVSKPDMKWTIGYGNTGKLSDGTPVVQGLVITKERASKEIVILAKIRYGNDINKVITRPLKQNEFDALISLAWNRGSLTKSIINAVNSNNNQAVVDSFMRVTTSKGKLMKGLVRRRKAELDVYFNGVSQPAPSFDVNGVGGVSSSGGNCYASTTNPVSEVNATASSGGSISASGSAKIEGEWKNGGSGGPYIKRLKNEIDGPQGQNGKLNENNLIKISNGSNNKLIAPAATAFENLYSAIKAAGFKITVSSSYRTYDEQIKIAKKNKPTKVGECSKAAEAGSSTHGWGRAIDISELYANECGKCSTQFNTKLYEWMYNNAYKYNWISPNWATKSTCTSQCEPWHWEFLMDSKAENPALDGAAPYSGSGYKDSCSASTNYVSEAELSAALAKISNFLVTGDDNLTTNSEIANSTDKPLDKDSKKTEAGKDVSIKTILKPEHEKDSLIISKNKEVTATGDENASDEEDTSAKPD